MNYDKNYILSKMDFNFSCSDSTLLAFFVFCFVYIYIIYSGLCALLFYLFFKFFFSYFFSFSFALFFSHSFFSLLLCIFIYIFIYNYSLSSYIIIPLVFIVFMCLHTCSLSWCIPLIFFTNLNLFYLNLRLEMIYLKNIS